MVEKKYGHFDDANREYVITDPKNPEGREKGVKQIMVDGKAIAGTIIPCLEGKHEVVVEM